MRYFIFLSFVFILSLNLEADINKQLLFQIRTSTFNETKSRYYDFGVNYEIQLLKKRPSPLFAKFRAKQKDNKRLTASILAFPFPFGIVGLHRIYLGCPPYVPVVYIGTLGGVFGALPLIDFFVLVFDKDTDYYLNNEKVFMWVK